MIRSEYSKIIFSALLLMHILIIASCAHNEMSLETTLTETTGISIKPDKANLIEGSTITLKAEIEPWNAKDKTVSWSSSDDAIATVSESGKVNAISPGTVTVTAIAGKASATAQITVRSSHIPADSVKIDGQTHLSIRIGETKEMTASVTPEDATESAVWSTSNPDILTIDPESGLIKGVSEGVAIITAKVQADESSVKVLVHPDFWIEQTDALMKTIPGSDIIFTTDTIRVAKGETATFQGVICSTEDQGTLTPEVTRFAPEGQGGLSIQPKIYWAREIKCSRHWDSWAGGPPKDELWAEGDMYPDPLMPADKWNITLKRGERQTLWVEFPIPRNATPGLYEGEIQVSGTGVASCKFNVEIYDVELPQKQGLKVVNWIHPYLETMNGGATPDEQKTNELIHDVIVPFMDGYGQNCYKLNTASIRQSHDFTIRPVPGEDRYEPQFKFQVYEDEINHYLKSDPDLREIHGINIIAGSDRGKGTMTLLGLELDKDGKPVINEKGFFNVGYYEVKGKVPEVEAYFVPYFRQMQEFLDSHKLPDGRLWTDMFVQSIFDEPTDGMAEAWNTVAGYVKQGAPRIKIIEPIETRLLDPKLLDYPCPTLGKIAGNRAKEGQEQWMYTCMQPQGNYANRFIRIPLIKTRIVHWVNYKYNAVGYLHWGLNFWIGAKNKPYDDACGDYLGGDMYIIYPGYNEVYPSIRLCAMRDGINDYDLLKAVEAKSPEKASEFCDRLVKSNALYNTDIEEFRRLRKDILDFLAGNR